MAFRLEEVVPWGGHSRNVTDRPGLRDPCRSSIEPFF